MRKGEKEARKADKIPLTNNLLLPFRPPAAEKVLLKILLLSDFENRMLVFYKNKDTYLTLQIIIFVLKKQKIVKRFAKKSEIFCKLGRKEKNDR